MTTKRYAHLCPTNLVNAVKVLNGVNNGYEVGISQDDGEAIQPAYRSLCASSSSSTLNSARSTPHRRASTCSCFVNRRCPLRSLLRYSASNSSLFPRGSSSPFIGMITDPFGESLGSTTK